MITIEFITNGEKYSMFKNSFKWILLSLLCFLFVGFTFLFVGCSNKENSQNIILNNTYPAKNIPNSNVYQDIADLVLKNGKKQRMLLLSIFAKEIA